MTARVGGFTDIFEERVAQAPAKTALVFLSDAGFLPAEVTYEQLYRRALSIAAALQERTRPSDRALLLYPSGLDFVEAFLGCMYAGVIPVPACPPRNSVDVSRVTLMARDCRPSVICAPSTSQIHSRPLDGLDMPSLATDTRNGDQAPSWHRFESSEDQIAFLQYTSGSVGAPKGVIVSHQNLLENQRLIQKAFGQTEDSVVVGWLPLFHDMGLVGNILHTLWLGAQGVLFSPESFIRRPRRWLEAITRYRGTVSGGPDFAYRWCVTRIKDADRAGLDLSSWEVAFNGAELVRRETLSRFSEAFAEAGFRSSAFKSCYGLAEATLMVAAVKRDETARDLHHGSNGQGGHGSRKGHSTTPERVDCGSPLCPIFIADYSGRRLSGGEEGEIWVSGDSVSRGYWNNPEESDRVFGATPAHGGSLRYLRTGDMGRLIDGRLYITGRLKETIVIRGRNYHPADVEEAVAGSHEAFRRGAGTAFAVDDGEQERLIVVHEISRSAARHGQRLAEEARAAVALRLALVLHAVVLVKPNTIPRTTSGKIQRLSCRAAYLAGTLPVISEWAGPSAASGDPEHELLEGTDEQVIAHAFREFLGGEAVGADSNFLSLGGDSVAAVQVIRRINQRLNCDLTPADLYDFPTAQALAERIRAAGLGVADANGPAEKQESSTQLSRVQQGIWLDLQRGTPANAYHIPIEIRPAPPVDIAALRSAWQTIVERHEILRSVFAAEPELRRTAVSDKLDWEERTIPHASSEGWQTDLRRLYSAAARRSFNLESGPLWRVRVVHSPSGAAHVLLVVHHLIADGDSLSFLVQQWLEVYNGLKEDGAPTDLPARPYTEYVKRERLAAISPAHDQSRSYWLKALEGVEKRFEIAGDFNERDRGSIASQELCLDGELSRQLSSLGRGSGAGLFAVLLAGFALLLQRISERTRIVIAAPVSEHDPSGFESIVGPCLRTAILCVDIDPANSFRDLVAHVRRQLTDAIRHRGYPLDELVHDLQISVPPGGFPLTSVAFNGLNFGAGPQARFSAEFRHDLGLQARFDWNCYVITDADEVRFRLDFSAARFRPETIAYVLRQFKALLRHAARQPEISMVSLDGFAALISEACSFPQRASESLARRFAEVAIQNGDSPAISGENGTLYYSDLYRRSGGIAAAVRERQGRGERALVGVLAQEPAHAIAGLLGVLMAGSAYVPLDSRHPDGRLADIIADSGLNLVVVERACAGRLRKMGEALGGKLGAIEIESTVPRALAFDELPKDGPDTQAYILYTSGSTGRPKGVLQPHGHVAHYIDAYRREFAITAEDRLSLFSSFAHDAGVVDIFSALLSGATLCPLRADAGDPLKDIAAKIESESISVFHCTPSFHRALLNGAGPRLNAPKLRLWVLGGEPTHSEDVYRHYLALPTTPLISLYGQTESTFNSYHSTQSRSPRARVLVGKAIDGICLRVMADDGNDTRIYQTGEIVVEGDCVSPGYWNRPDETARKFGCYPSSLLKRWYRTGDFGRRLPNGDIEYAGRRDGMVKLNGHRIEMEEIQSHLRKVEGIQDVAVVFQAETSRLCAYLVAKDTLDDEGIEAILRRHLPAYMMPALIRLPQLPRTPNGKLDTSALLYRPSIHEEQPRPEQRSQDPPRILEDEMSRLFAEALKTSAVDRRKSFFSMGGTSLAAMLVLAKFNQKFGARLRLAEFLDEPTVEGLSRRVRPARQLASPVRQADLPLSNSQRQLWTTIQLPEAAAAYNLFVTYELRGPVDAGVLASGFQNVVDRHWPLRATFHQQGNNVWRKIHHGVKFLPQEVDLSSSPNPIAAARELARLESSKVVDLSASPLLWVGICSLGPDRSVVMVRLPHIVADGWSMMLLMREALSVQPEMETEPLAPDGPGAVIEAPPGVLDYWERKLEGWTTFSLFTSRPPSRVFAGKTVSRVFAPEWREKLQKIASESGCSQFAALVSLVKVLLYRYSGQSDVTVGTVVAHRDLPEQQRRIDLGVSLAALRDHIRGKDPFHRILAQVSTTVREAVQNLCPIELIVEKINAGSDPSRHPLFDITVTFDEMHDRALIDAARKLGPDVVITPLAYDRATSKFDLSFAFRSSGETLILELEYATWIEEGIAERALGHLEQLLQNIAAEPDIAVNEANFLTPAECREVSNRNATERALSGEMRLHYLFDQQSRMTPDDVAIMEGERRITYRDLSLRAGRLAIELRARGVSRGSLVVLCLDPSIDFVTAALAILKAGGAYVPVDPEQPRERLSFVVDDTKAAAILTKEEICRRHELTDDRVFRLEQLAPSELEAATRGNEPLAEEAQPNDVAYVIYTSGTKGTPKGVLIEHRSVANLVSWHQRAFGVRAASRTWMFASVGFDASVWELWPYLLAGAKIHILPKELRGDLGWLAEFARTHALTHVFLPTHLYEHLARSAENLPPGLQILTGGDRLRLKDDKGLRVWNNYGPSECTVVTTSVLLNDEPSQPISIGKPIDNMRIYILDPQGLLAADGFAGEIHIAGAGVARGYLNQPELTAERFVVPKSPLIPESLLYRTGDAARYLPNHAIEFLGRLDDQIKIGGIRVEPAEIELALLSHEPVKEAAAIARFDGARGRHLVAYIVPRQEGAIEPERLFAHLAIRLSRPLWPAAIFCVDRLPLNASGKVDRRRLPVLDESCALRPSFAAPRNRFEKAVVETCQAVLQRDRVSLLDDFFLLGGSSITAIQFCAGIRNALGIELPLRGLFDKPVLAQVAETLAALAPGSLAPELQAEQDGPLGYPLSLAQERLWFLDQLNPGEAAYNIHGALRLRGPLVLEALRRSLALILERHESLRMYFPSAEGVPRVEIQPAYIPVLPPEPVAELELEAILRREAELPFNLSRGPLLRMRLLKLAPDDHVLLAAMHHIIADGWSVALLFREWLAFYKEEIEGGTATPPALPLRYIDYARKQRELVASGAIEKSLAYWRQQLADAPPLLDLPADRPRPLRQSAEGARVRREWPAAFCQELAAFAREQHATPFMAAAAAFVALVARYSGQEEVLVGYPIHGRPDRSLEPMIGLFVNTLLLRCKVRPETCFAELVQEVRKQVLSGQQYSDAPFEQLVDAVRPARNLSHNPLFQVMIAMQPLPLEPVEAGHLKVEPLALEAAAAKVDLTLDLQSGRSGFQASWTYSAALFDRARIEQMAGCFETLLSSGIRDATRNVMSLPLMTDSQKSRMIADWGSGPRFAMRLRRGLHELFQEQAERTPDAIAVVEGGRHCTFAGLERLANRVANFLSTGGIEPEEPIGVCMGRNVEMIACLMGVLKAGGAYVPMDPAYPPRRLSQIVDSVRPRFVFGENSLRRLWEQVDARIVAMDEESGPIGYPATFAAGKAFSPDQIAYIIHTSGSTGSPKGIAISHANAAAMLQWAEAEFGPEDRAGVLASTSICFDLSIFEIFLPLTRGGTIILAEDALQLPDLFERDRVTLLNTVPSAARALLEVHGIPSSVRTINLAGEPLPRELANAIRRLPHVSRLMNLYGPSEDTTYSTGAAIHWAQGGMPPIGRPLHHRTAYVLDSLLEPVPPGVAGELYLGGDGVTRGYHGRSRATAERFIPDAFAQEPGKRLYRTGDRARYSLDGALEFIGRADRQIKLRGYRIELEEIEEVLRHLPGVLAAAVVLRDSPAGGPQLAGYVAAGKEHALEPDALRAMLAARLPEWFVPAHMVVLPELPLTPNGKIDRAALPGPAAPASAEAATPRTPTESLIEAIWLELLGGPISPRQDFFAAGGHSLLAARVAGRLRSQLGIGLPLRALFEYPTIASLAAYVDRLHRDQGGSPLPAAIPEWKDGFPLSFAQQRLWVLNHLMPESPDYNMPAAVRLRGELDPEALQEGLQRLVERHELLSCRIAKSEGVPMLRVDRNMKRELSIRDARLEELPVIRQAEAERPFNLSADPLFRVTLVRLAADHHVLLFTSHHLIGDGWSMSLIVRDWIAFYLAARRRENPALSKPRVRYADYTHWQRERFAGETLAREQAYWVGVLEGLPPLLELPIDRPRPAMRSSSGAAVTMRLSAELATATVQMGNRHGLTLFMTMASVLAAVLARYSGQSDIAIGYPAAGRTRPEFEDVVGLFVNTLVLRCGARPRRKFWELAGEVHQRVLEGQDHQELQFDKVVEALQPLRSTVWTPLFQVMLTLQNGPEAPLSAPGLLMERLHHEPTVSPFDLSLDIEEVSPGNVRLCWTYSKDIFDRATIERMGSNFIAALECAVTSVETSLAGLVSLTAAERKMLLGWNAAQEMRKAEREAGRLVHHLIEERVAQTPDAIALISGSQCYSYKHLDGCANHLAWSLKAMGIGPEQRVAICCGRKPEMVVAMLAVLKAGGAWAPILPDCPGARMREIIAAADIRVALTDPGPAEKFSSAGLAVLNLDDGVMRHTSSRPPQVAGTPEMAAYLIFTSGTTGRPKGVIVPHRALAGYVPALLQAYDLRPSDRVLQIASVEFDVSVQEIITTLAGGATLVLPRDGATADEVSRDLELQGVTVMDAAPSLWRMLLQTWERTRQGAPNLRLLVSGADVLDPRLASALLRAAPARMLNAYGPTETTVTATLYEVGAPQDEFTVPVGRPLSGYGLRILDEEGAPLPIGAAGELCIAGLGVSRGYLNEPRRTAESFQPDAGASTPGVRLYRTGDRARFRGDGNVELRGRTDRQVKLRGFRIELDEVTVALQAQAGVADAAVALRDKGQSSERLVAFLVAGKVRHLERDALIAGLGRLLPARMIPAEFVQLEDLPLDHRGKIDFKMLAESTGHTIAQPASVPPATPVELRLAALWSSILGHRQAGVHDDFFQSGGNSVLASQFVLRVSQAFNVDLPLRAFFASPTISGVNTWIDAAIRARADAPPFAGDREEIEL